MLPSTQFLKKAIGEFSPEIGLILGSGLGFFADDRLHPYRTLPYDQIPDFHKSTVEGHKGRLVFGHVDRRRVICMQGRFHFYEGHPISQVVAPIRVMAELGIGVLIVTNAAGGINTDFPPGTLMLITDHINLLGTNPLIGDNYDELGPRFPDMTTAYDQQLRDEALAISRRHGIDLRQGVYLATTGPSYETPAEIRAFRTLGADAVGMSTVPEAIVANHAGVRVCGISCITNLAAGLSDQQLSHDEVTATAERVKEQFADLLEELVKVA